MTATAYERIVDALRGAGLTVKDNGHGQAMAQCPAHDDRNPSLSITSTEGRTLLYCHHGCETIDVLAAIELTMADLYNEPYQHPKHGQVYAKYTYPGGRVVLRTADKQFPQPGDNKDRSLYHADRIGYATTVYVVEGEEDVHAVEAVGGVAVCPAMGAGKADKFDWSPLNGKDVPIVADRDKPGRKHARQVAELLNGIAKSVTIVEPAVGKDFSDHIAAGHTLDDLQPVHVNGAALQFTVKTLSDVVPERVSWLWPGRLPLGKVITLDGDPGEGKSTLALTFAAIITTGGVWPDKTRCDHPGDVILLSAEDGLADTIRPRLDAAGADVTRVHAVQGVPLDGDGDALRMATLADVELLRHLINRTHARLAIVDVFMAYLPTGTDSHRDQDVRQVLARLAALAEATGCTILLLRHLNKGKGDPLYRGGGSIGIVGASRVGLLVANDPDDDNLRVLASLKNNLAPMPPSLTFRLLSDDLYDVSRVEWIGVSEHDARALLAEPTTKIIGSGAEAEQWLQDYLTVNGRVPSQTAKDEGRREGHSERTLKRAASKLGVIIESEGFPRTTYWTLRPTMWSHPGQSGQSGPGSELGPNGPTEPTGGLFGSGGPPRFCPGCGNYWVTHGHHRPDCTALSKQGRPL